jgi:hypothetical protein
MPRIPTSRVIVLSQPTRKASTVHRFGKIADHQRPFSGQLTPIRVKGIPRPAPIRFDVDVVPVEGTNQTAAILKNRALGIPKKLEPVVEALREFEDQSELSASELNEGIDEVAGNRAARMRYRNKLIAAGVLEPIEEDKGKLPFYRFHDPFTI